MRKVTKTTMINDTLGHYQGEKTVTTYFLLGFIPVFQSTMENLVTVQ